MDKRQKFSAIAGLCTLILLLFFKPATDKILKKDWENVVRQNDPYSCGFCCLKMIFNSKGIFVEDNKLKNDIKITNTGTSMLNIMQSSKKYNLKCTGFKLNYNSILKVKTPTIIRIYSNHFVVLDSIINDNIYIRNPLRGKQVLNKKKFLQLWDGNILVFENN